MQEGFFQEASSVKARCCIGKENVIIVCNEEKNIFGSLYHVKEPRTKVPDLPLSAALQHLQQWNERGIMIQVLKIMSIFSTLQARLSCNLPSTIQQFIMVASSLASSRRGHDNRGILYRIFYWLEESTDSSSVHMTICDFLADSHQATAFIFTRREWLSTETDGRVSTSITQGFGWQPWLGMAWGQQLSSALLF